MIFDIVVIYVRYRGWVLSLIYWWYILMHKICMFTLYLLHKTKYIIRTFVKAGFADSCDTNTCEATDPLLYMSFRVQLQS